MKNGIFGKKKPVLLLFTVGVMVIYNIANYYHQRMVWTDDFSRTIAIKEQWIENYTVVSRALGELNEWDRLRERLEEARQYGYFDYYILQYNDVTLWGASPYPELGELDQQYDVINQAQITKNLSYVTISPAQKYKLTIGLIKDPDLYVSMRFAEYKGLLVDEAVYYMLIVLGVVLWTFRDYFKIMRKVRSGKASELRSITTNSAEGDLLLRGFDGFSRTVEWLESENVLLNRQVLPSLQKEIKSGRKPPYDFGCTMVRTDINNFSTIYNTHDVTQLMSTINEFFIEVSHIVARYRGLVHEFVGDEVIYYFKDEESSNSLLIAVGAIRDINAVAEKYNERTQKEFGYAFTVKSSLARGKVRFGPLVNGFTIAGAVLIETVRTLTHVVEKDGNALVFSKEHEPSLNGLVGVKDLTTVRFKGYSEDTVLVQYQGFVSIEFLLQKLSLETVHNLAFYRSDEDLLKILTYLRNTWHRNSIAVTLSALHEIKNVESTKTEVDWPTLVCDWMDEVQESIREESTDGKLKLLSSIPKILQHLYPTEQLPPHIEARLSDFVSTTDVRTSANVIEVLTDFGSQDRERMVNQLSSETSTRLIASAIVHDGLKELDKSTIRRISDMMKSRDPQEVCAGLYALGELAYRHRQRDLVYYSTQTNFLDLIQLLPNYARSDQKSVRIQSFIAARKSADDAVIKNIRDEVMKSASDVLFQEAERFLEPDHFKRAA